jgi:two-component system sensor histidine kinase PrrB
VEAGSFTPVDLAEVVGAAVADLRRTHPAARVTLDLAPGCTVYGWPQGLRSAVDNLLTNAALHGAGPDGTAAVEVVLRPSGDRTTIRLTVADHGPGIPPAARADVFHRLALVGQQAALHSGTVTAADRPDGHPGTCFVLDLPGGDAADADTLVLPRRRDWLSGRPPA